VDTIQRAPQIVVSSVVIGELLAGFAVGSHEEKNRDELRQFLASVRVAIVAVDEDTPAYYATVYRTLRAKGRPIPTNDMWIAATALQHGCALFSYDGHFQAIEGLVVGTTAAELGLP
jgi:tRNA(fMet)-specific endonuclease VapC